MGEVLEIKELRVNCSVTAPDILVSPCVYHERSHVCARRPLGLVSKCLSRLDPLSPSGLFAHVRSSSSAVASSIDFIWDITDFTWVGIQ